MNVNPTGAIQIIAALTMPIGIGLLFWHRVRTKKAAGARAVQLIVAIVTAPTILILTLEETLGGEAASALLGAVIGYVLSGVGQYRSGRQPPATHS